MKILMQLRHHIIDFLFGYWSKSQVYSIRTLSPDLSNRKKLIIVLNRSDYEESSKVFPVESEKELNKVLSLSNYRFDVYSLTPQPSSSSIRVNFWLISKLKEIRCFFLLPETLVLSNSLDEDIIYQIANNGEPYYFVNTKNGFYSSFKSTLVNSPEMFANASGVAYTDIVQLDDTQVKAAINIGISKLPYYRLLTLKVKNTLKTGNNFNYKIFVPSLAAIMLYYFSTSLYIMGKSSYLDNNIAAIQGQSNLLLKKKIQLQKGVDLLGTVSSLTGGSSRTSKIWEILHPLYEQEVRFSAIRIDGNKVFLSGYAPSALATLEELNKNSLVKDAQFRGSQRSSRQGERFTLEFNYE